MTELQDEEPAKVHGKWFARRILLCASRQADDLGNMLSQHLHTQGTVQPLFPDTLSF